ncbi:putative COBYRINIC ACID A,C-DIAMIDE SYNTHASE COBB [Mycobacterium tuberculosis 49-02]|nr:putative COBYRINIC ACID A,C-DIAMIDE SYNTHASE COBB [Mycobacterium tuberculosis 49-02]
MAQDGCGLVLDTYVSQGRHRRRSCGRGGGRLGRDRAPAGHATSRLLSAGRVHLPTEVGLARRRRSRRCPASPAWPSACGDHRARRTPAVGCGRRSGDRDDQGEAPDGCGPQGAEGHRVVMRVSAVAVAAPASGSGKTTIATGLIGALRQAGHTVAPFKVGPDFIDPGYHALAAGRPGRNLDPVLVGERLIGPLYAHGVAGADIAVIEGVLGLFDGRIGPAGGAPAAGSTAHVAALLGAPVILVVDARGQSHSVAALLHGFSTFDTATRIAGVILNRVGSARHEQVLRQACDQAGVAVLGAIPRTAELELPTRYLGLVTAVEYGRRARLAVQAMTAVVARHVDLAAVIACAGSQAAHPPWDPVIAVGNTARQPATVAIAAGRAFTFGYAEHAEMLRAAGAEVVEFDPLSETLPEGTDAVVLPGGFPEQFTAELSANDTVRRQINELAAAGAPVHAECAGLLYLVSELDGHPMCGVVAGSARFTQHLKLGYRDAVAVVDSALYSVGERVVGHEFHRTAVTFADSYQPAWVYQGQDVDDVRDGAVHSGVHASYLHTHPAATPRCGGAFRRTCGLQYSTSVTALRKAGPEIRSGVTFAAKGVATRGARSPRLRSPLALMVATRGARSPRLRSPLALMVATRGARSPRLRSPLALMVATRGARSPRLRSPLGLAGDREPLSGRVTAGWQEGRRGWRGHGRPAPVTPADRQWRGRARDRPQRHPRRRGDGPDHLVGA